MRRMGKHLVERPIARCLAAAVMFLAVLGCNVGTAWRPSPTPPATRTPVVKKYHDTTSHVDCHTTVRNSHRDADDGAGSDADF